MSEFSIKQISLFVAFALISISSSACEICGCGVGNFYLGMLPHFKNKFVGIRYQYFHYQTRLRDDVSQFSNDYYKSVELWSGWNINSRLQVLAFVPFTFNRKNTDDGNPSIKGLGDITLLSNFKIFSEDKSNQVKDQQIWVGGGIKLPTGKYNLDLSQPDVNKGDINSQSGTGSLDFLMNLMYNLTIRNYGINASVNYKINTANKDKYRFGNRFTANTFAFYRFRIIGFGISPNIGFLYENAASNFLNKVTVEDTGGSILSQATGVEINHKKIALGCNVQLPVTQNFASGQTQSRIRGMVHLTFAL